MFFELNGKTIRDLKQEFVTGSIIPWTPDAWLEHVREKTQDTQVIRASSRARAKEQFEAVAAQMWPDADAETVDRLFEQQHWHSLPEVAEEAQYVARAAMAVAVPLILKAEGGFKPVANCG